MLSEYIKAIPEHKTIATETIIKLMPRILAITFKCKTLFIQSAIGESVRKSVTDVIREL